jgi:hypothetical protein
VRKDEMVLCGHPEVCDGLFFYVYCKERYIHIPRKKKRKEKDVHSFVGEPIS